MPRSRMYGRVVPLLAFDTTYYATAAQIIPVLLLALIFEQSLFKRLEPVEERDAGTSAVLLALLTLMFGGEALAGLALFPGTEKPAHVVDVVIGMGVGAGLISLAVPVFNARSRALAKHLSDRDARHLGGAVLAIVLVGAIIGLVTNMLAAIAVVVLTLSVITLCGEGQLKRISTRNEDEESPDEAHQDGPAGAEPAGPRSSTPPAD